MGRALRGRDVDTSIRDQPVLYNLTLPNRSEGRLKLLDPDHGEGRAGIGIPIAGGQIDFDERRVDPMTLS